MAGSQPAGLRAFAVKRGSQGNGLLEVTKPDGSMRVIVFQRGRATGYHGNQVDRSSFKTSRQGDLTIVHIGDERHEVPDIAINGVCLLAQVCNFRPIAHIALAHGEGRTAPRGS
jgi:hypothetical protein